jgi:FtsZ-interacting cell division protein ZipA
MKTIAFIFILGLVATAAWAETAEVDAQFFHPAASSYIQGDSTTASNLVVKGLSLYPEDGKLKRLKELLDKQQQDKQKDQDKQDQDKKDQDKKDQQDKQDQDKKDQQDKDKQDQDQQDQDQNKQDQQDQQPSEPQSAEQMSADEAKQLMDAMKQEEENKRLQLHPVMGAPVKVDKDW